MWVWSVRMHACVPAATSCRTRTYWRKYARTSTHTYRLMHAITYQMRSVLHIMQLHGDFFNIEEFLCPHRPVYLHAKSKTWVQVCRDASAMRKSCRYLCAWLVRRTFRLHVWGLPVSQRVNCQAQNVRVAWNHASAERCFARWKG